MPRRRRRMHVEPAIRAAPSMSKVPRCGKQVSAAGRTAPEMSLQRLIQAFGQLDDGSPGVGDGCGGNAERRVLPIRRRELDAFRFQLLAELLEAADLEADVIDGAAGGPD